MGTAPGAAPRYASDRASFCAVCSRPEPKEFHAFSQWRRPTRLSTMPTFDSTCMTRSSRRGPLAATGERHLLFAGHRHGSSTPSTDFVGERKHMGMIFPISYIPPVHKCNERSRRSFAAIIVAMIIVVAVLGSRLARVGLDVTPHFHLGGLDPCPSTCAGLFVGLSLCREQITVIPPGPNRAGASPLALDMLDYRAGAREDLVLDTSASPWFLRACRHEGLINWLWCAFVLISCWKNERHMFGDSGSLPSPNPLARLRHAARELKGGWWRTPKT